jgi:hypothetical protein
MKRTLNSSKIKRNKELSNHNVQHNINGGLPVTLANVWWKRSQCVVGKVKARSRFV